jgi:hypothetical protein
MAVTSGDALVGSSLVGAGTLTLTSIPAGNYEIHVVGAPGPGPGSGPFGIQVVDSHNTQIAAFQGTLALPSPALPNGEGVLDDSFVLQAGSGSTCVPPQADQCFTVSLSDLHNDLQLPALSTLTMLLIAQGSPTPVLTLPAAGTATVPLTAGVPYRIFVAALAGGTANAGLFNAVITGAGGTVVYGHAGPVGNTQSLGSPTLATGTATLHVTDLKFPTQLSTLGAVMTFDGQVVAQVAGTGQQSFTATTQTYEAFGVGTAAAGSAGSYAVNVTGIPATFSVAHGVTDAASGLSTYSFNTNLASGGTSTASLTDFQFPAALTSVSLAAVQGGALVGTPISSVGILDFNPAAGPLTLLVFAKPGAGMAGLFGLDVAPGGFDVTQAVGGLFTVRELSITNAGSYSITAKDLGFPANFANFDTIVTQGTAKLGAFYNGGTFNFTATPGTYFLNVIAQTTGADQAGTYTLTVAVAPPAPTISLSVDHSQVGSGSTVDIIWSTQNATSCTASNSGSGGWSGNVALSGVATSAPLTSNTTFTLQCTGAGGPQSQSVNVTVTPVSGSGGGGGGSLEAALLLLLGLAVLVRLQRAAAVTGTSRQADKLVVS